MTVMNLYVTISCHHFYKKKIVARSQILWPKYTKFNFGCGFAQTPPGELATFPNTL